MNKRILIVDDEKLVRETFLDILNEFGYQANTAKNGLEALDLIKAASYDIVITDIQMPKKNGIELFYEIKDKFRETTVIIMTGFYNEYDEDKLLTDGVYKIIKKPVDFFELQSIIDQVQ